MQSVQKLAKNNATPDVVFSVLENFNPEIQQSLQQNRAWQNLKGKSPLELEEAATNLLHDPDIVVNVISVINPAIGKKIENSPILKTLCNKNAPAMGSFVLGIGRKLGFIQ